MSNRSAAFLAYLLPLLGPLYVFLTNRRNEFAMFHAKQSLALTALAVGAPVAWAVVSWVLLWIPTAGPLLAVPGFTMVVLAYLFLLVVWILGMANALRGEWQPLPVVGQWAEKISL